MLMKKNVKLQNGVQKPLILCVEHLMLYVRGFCGTYESEEEKCLRGPSLVSNECAGG